MGPSNCISGHTPYGLAIAPLVAIAPVCTSKILYTTIHSTFICNRPKPETTEMSVMSEKKPISKGHIPYDSIYMTFLK